MLPYGVGKINHSKVKRTDDVMMWIKVAVFQVHVESIVKINLSIQMKLSPDLVGCIELNPKLSV